MLVHGGGGGGGGGIWRNPPPPGPKWRTRWPEMNQNWPTDRLQFDRNERFGAPVSTNMGRISVPSLTEIGRLGAPKMAKPATHPKQKKFLWGKMKFGIESQKGEAHFRYTNLFCPHTPPPPIL